MINCGYSLSARHWLGALCLLWVATATAHGQLFTVEMESVPASDGQVGGPDYSYNVAIFEVTNAEYAIFLNDAEFHNEEQNPGFGNERGANMAFRPEPFGGDVGLISGDSGDIDAIFDISRSLLTYVIALPIGQRFGLVTDKADHPIVGASWLGAVKYCNWLTIDQGFGLSQRCYAEGESEFDWFPVTIGNEVGGTQQATNAVRDLTEPERHALVEGFRGFRLLMDQGGTAVGAVNAVPRPYNEWYKAASFDPAAPDTPRTVFVGFPFEEHTVPPDHWVHGFGRDPLANADANYRGSGDPFDDPDAAVIATTPVGYYDGSDHGGVFQTAPNNNRYGLFDMSGNAWEFLNDQVTITDSLTPDRSIAGGSYRSNLRQVTTANRGDIGPGTTRPVVGFRVMRVPSGDPVPAASTWSIAVMALLLLVAGTLVLRSAWRQRLGAAEPEPHGRLPTHVRCDSVGRSTTPRSSHVGRALPFLIDCEPFPVTVVQTSWSVADRLDQQAGWPGRSHRSSSDARYGALPCL